jgi:copper transport protein
VIDSDRFVGQTQPIHFVASPAMPDSVPTDNNALTNNPIADNAMASNAMASNEMSRKQTGGRSGSVVARVLALLTLVLVGNTAWATMASAHASVSSTSPEAGSTLPQSPTAVSITFDQGVTVPSGAVRILNQNAERIGVQKPRIGSKTGDPNTVSVAVPKLPEGAYVVSWRAVSEDGHPIRGAFTFRVGSSGDQAAVAKLARELLTNGNTDPALSFTTTIARVLSFASMMLLLGGVAYLLLFRTPSLGDNGKVAKILTGAAIVAGLSGLWSVVFFGPFVAGESFGGLRDGTLLDDTISSSIGRSMLLRTVALVVLGFVTLRSLSSPARTAITPQGKLGVTSVDYAALLGLSIIVLGLSTTIGHGATGRWRVVGALATGLHIAAASTWIGLLVLVLAATSRAAISQAATSHSATSQTATSQADTHTRGTSKPSLNTPPPTTSSANAGPRTQAVVSSIERFSTVAFWSVVALVFSGTLNGLRQIGSTQGITATTYGRLLLIKIAIVVAVLVLGGLSRRSLGQRRAAIAERANSASPEPTVHSGGSPSTALTGSRLPPALVAIRKRMAVESILAIVVIVVTALLVNSPPPIEVLGKPVTVIMRGTTFLLDTTVAPAQAGTNRLHFYALTPEGQTQIVEAMTVTAALPASDIAPIDLKVVRAGPNHFQALKADLPVKGAWRFTVDVQLDTFTAESVAATVTVR